MTSQTSATIQIGPHAIPVQCFPMTDQGDFAVPMITADVAPIAVSDWPLTPEAVAALAAEKLQASGGNIAQRADCVWALKAATLSETHYFAEARTAGQRQATQARGRRAALRGDIS